MRWWKALSSKLITGKPRLEQGNISQTVRTIKCNYSSDLIVQSCAARNMEADCVDIETKVEKRRRIEREQVLSGHPALRGRNPPPGVYPSLIDHFLTIQDIKDGRPDNILKEYIADSRQGQNCREQNANASSVRQKSRDSTRISATAVHESTATTIPLITGNNLLRGNLEREPMHTSVGTFRNSETTPSAERHTFDGFDKYLRGTSLNTFGNISTCVHLPDSQNLFASGPPTMNGYFDFSTNTRNEHQPIYSSETSILTGPSARKTSSSHCQPQVSLTSRSMEPTSREKFQPLDMSDKGNFSELDSGGNPSSLTPTEHQALQNESDSLLPNSGGYSFHSPSPELQLPLHTDSPALFEDEYAFRDYSSPFSSHISPSDLAKMFDEDETGSHDDV